MKSQKTEVDLFNFPNEHPIELKAIFQKYEEKIKDGMSYKDLSQMRDETESIGYTFDFYLDAEPYGLRPNG